MRAPAARLGLAWLAVVVVAGAGGARADASGALAPSLGVALEYDTNAPRRAYDPDSGGKPPPGDALVRAQAALATSSTALGARIDVDGAAGVKLFFQEHDQSMAVARLLTSLARPLPWGFALRVRGFTKGRGQRNRTRTYALHRTDAELVRPLWFGFSGRASLWGAGFYSVDNPLFSSVEGGASVGTSWSLTLKERIDVDAAVGVRGYPVLARVAREGESEDRRPRADAPLRLSVGLTSVRSVFASLRYTFTRNGSNSRGDSYIRHRVTATAGVRLPFDITTTGQAALQITSYDDGLSVGQQLLLGDDDESQNSLSLAVSRPWWLGIATEARFSWYGNEFARERVTFSRMTAQVGIRWDL